MRSDEQIDRIALRYALETDFYFFVRYAFWKQTGRKWLRNWHHEKLCRYLEEVYEGKHLRTIINMPPRYSKTEIVVVMFMAWCLAKAPDCEFINTSYAARLASNNSAKCRDVVTSGWFQEIFPECAIKGDSSAKDDWRTEKNGIVYSAGSGGTITGFGAGKMRDGFGGAIIVDDPHKADDVLSDVIRQGVIEWFGNTLESRCNTPQTPIIVVMQRLHPEDLSGFLLGGGNGETWEHICLSAIGEDGQPLWPEKHPLERLKKMEAANLRVFISQYQQKPSDALFKNALWQKDTLDAAWRRGKPLRGEPDWQRVVVGVDPSGGGDDVGIVTVARRGKRFIVLEDATIKAASPLAWATAVAKTCDRWAADCVVAEKNFGGDMVESTLRTGGVETRVELVTASRGKHVRAEPIAALYDQDLVDHLDQFPEMEAELMMTTPEGYMGPKSPNRLDALVWALTKLSGRQVAFGFA